MAPSERAKQFHREAEGGSLDAQTQLGLGLLEGAEGLEKEYVRGATLLRKAGSLGHAGAEGCLGACYAQGTGVEQDSHWRWRGGKGADQDFAEAQFFYGQGVRAWRTRRE